MNTETQTETTTGSMESFANLFEASRLVPFGREIERMNRDRPRAAHFQVLRDLLKRVGVAAKQCERGALVGEPAGRALGDGGGGAENDDAARGLRHRRPGCGIAHGAVILVQKAELRPSSTKA